MSAGWMLALALVLVVAMVLVSMLANAWASVIVEERERNKRWLKP